MICGNHQNHYKMMLKKLNDGIAFMKDTVMKSTLFMQPQYRNRHSYDFGGYLLRQTFELAYCTQLHFPGRTKIC